MEHAFQGKSYTNTQTHNYPTHQPSMTDDGETTHTQVSNNPNREGSGRTHNPLTKATTSKTISWSQQQPTHPTPQPLYEPAYNPSDWCGFFCTVDYLARQPCTTLVAPTLKFTFTMEAVSNNATILQEY
eukprot:8249400-Ditylum_brightwellii.AAC.1